MQDTVFQQPSRRQKKAEKDGQQTGNKGQKLPSRPHLVTADRLIPPCMMKLPPTAIETFQQDQRKHENHQDRGQLRRSGWLPKAKPGAVDAGREGINCKILDRAEVTQRFHQGKGNPSNNGRPRERQGNSEETAPRPAPKGPPDFQRGNGLIDKGGAAHKIDIWIQYQTEHQDGAAKAAHRRKPVIRPRPAKGIPKGSLHRSGKIKHPRIGVGDDIGRHGKRQEQRPTEYASSRKIAHGDQPRRPHPDQQDKHRHPKRKKDGIGQINRQDRTGQMSPDIAGRNKNITKHHQHRQGEDQRQDKQPQRHCRETAMRAVPPPQVLPIFNLYNAHGYRLSE